MWVAQGTRCPRCKRKVAGFRGLFSCARCARRICAQCLGAARDFDVPPFREYLCPDCKKPSHRGQQELLERIRADRHRSPLGPLYKELNGKFFDGRLPNFRAVRTSPWERLPRDASAWCYPDSATIAVRYNLDRGLQATLLHQMCHIPDTAAESPSHGPLFQERLARLMRQLPPRLRRAVEKDVERNADDYFTPAERISRALEIVTKFARRVCIYRRLVATPGPQSYPLQLKRLEEKTWERCRQSAVDAISPTTTEAQQVLLTRLMGFTRHAFCEWAVQISEDEMQVRGVLDDLHRRLHSWLHASPPRLVKLIALRDIRDNTDQYRLQALTEPLSLWTHNYAAWVLLESERQMGELLIRRCDDSLEQAQRDGKLDLSQSDAARLQLISKSLTRDMLEEIRERALEEGELLDLPLALELSAHR